MADNFDRFLPDWTVGTLTIVSGSKNFTATGAQLNLAPVRMGDTIITPSGLTLVIQSINENGNGGVLFQNAPAAAAGTFQTLIRFQSDNSRFTGQLAALVQLMSGGNIQSLNALASNIDLLPYFNGVGTMATTGFTALARTLLSRANGAQMYGDLGTVPIAQIPDMAPNKAYRRGNILGNVAQSGGVPTGALIQSGSNANGSFVRFADGLQICWNVIPTPTMTTDQPFGSGFMSNSFTYSYAANFLGFSSVSWSYAQGMSFNSSGGSDSCTTRWYSPVARLGEVSARVSFIAIGSWF